MKLLSFVSARVQEMSRTSIKLKSESVHRTPLRSIIKSSSAAPRKVQKVTFFDFKGLMAPVFTCFKDDETQSLELKHIENYALWLKRELINGILVNSIFGEGPALGLNERKLNTEAWWKAALKHDFILMVHIGAAPLSDVLDLAGHADDLGVHAVLCLPEFFYKPHNIDELLGYCKIVAKKCKTRPFFYYHMPDYTGVDFDMCEFCRRAEEMIPNFFGILYASLNLEMGIKCLRPGRVVILGIEAMLASGMLLGFESGMFIFLNGIPKKFLEIYRAMKKGDIRLARTKQLELNALMGQITHYIAYPNWLPEVKKWFNAQSIKKDGAGFSAGPSRTYY